MPPTQHSASGQLPTGDRGPNINALQVVMIITASGAVLLRFVARKLSAAGLWWDDWMILAALIPSIGININNLIATSLGLGEHIWEVQDAGHSFLKSLFALELIYTTALALNKLAVLLMYQRLFAIERKLAIAIKVVAVVVVAWWIGVEIATLFQCEPVNKFWEYSVQGRCFDVVKFFKGSAIPNVILDVVILLIPQPVIWKLQLSRGNKVALCCIFLLGAFTAVNSIGRLAAIIDFHQGVDFTWDSFTAIIWYSLEPAIGIICACLPCMGPLLRGLPGSPFGSQNGSFTASRSDVSRALPKSGPRSLWDLDAGSVERLTQAESSCKASVYASASPSQDDFRGRRSPSEGLELDVVHVRNTSTHVTSPISP